jgi:hypothetical protein
MLDIIFAINDLNLIGAAFPDAGSWSSWQTALKAIYGLPLSDQEFSLFRECTGREEAPQGPADETYLVVGRRGGKSRITAAMAVYQAVFADTSVLSPGEIGLVAVVANDREQAGIILSYCREIFKLSPLLGEMVEGDLAQEIKLNNGVSIKILTCSTASVRGYTLLSVILEEASFYRVEGKDPGREILRSLRPALLTTNGPLFIISSPYSKAGIVWEGFSQHYGKDGNILVWRAPSQVMNPTLPAHIIEKALAEDYESAKAEYLAQFRDDIAGFLDVDTLDNLVVTGRRELPPQSRFKYYAFSDPSGGRGDSFTLAIAHKEDEKIILDLVHRKAPPFNPGTVVEEFCQVLKEYNLKEVEGDAYAAEWVTTSFKAHGINYKNSKRDRSQIYSEALPLFTRGQVELLDNKVLVSELRGLERKVRPLGREMINHGPGGHDDVANSACGALVLAAAKQVRPQVRWIGGDDGWREVGRLM